MIGNLSSAASLCTDFSQRLSRLPLDLLERNISKRFLHTFDHFKITPALLFEAMETLQIGR